MKRLLAIACVLVAAAALEVFATGAGHDGGNYRVRAIFMNAFSVIPGEDVKIAGVKVGKIESLEVTPDHKAAVVLRIDRAGFDDFRADAQCTIRPQSLIGEKFVDCRPTLPRAPGSPAPPPLKKIPDGEEGAGQYLLPLGSSGTSVDPDLINDIQTLPYAQRFRLIFNELGAGLAGRGKDIEVVVKRANPVLRDVDRLFGILSAQRDRLAQLASDSDQILGPFAREKAHVAGFFTNAGASAQASAEHGAELEESLRKLPTFLREFRLTMGSLQDFSDAGAPVFTDLGKAAPSLTDATRTLTPFSEATTVALKSLGATGEAAGPIFREAEPIVSKTTALAKTGVTPTTELSALLTNIDETGGWDGLVSLIYNSTASLNGFDQYGHFGRTLLTLSNCLDYEARAEGNEGGGCAARFNGPGVGQSANTSSADLLRLLEQSAEERTGGTVAGAGPATGIGQAGAAGGEASIAEAAKTGGTAPLMDYLLGP